MKITDKILSIPPYISTAWKNIVSMHVESRPYGHVLIIELITGNKVEVPNLDPKIIDQVFAVHAQVLEQEGKTSTAVTTQTFSFPLPFPIEGLTSVLQHNPEQADTPPLPPEMLEKIQSLKGVLPEDLTSMQKAEPHCNCPYCQITRAITGDTVEEAAPAALPEEEVSEADLQFRTWDIKQESERLYSVTNPFDEKVNYKVFLGEPLGCTCGNKNCEHIQAVLRT